MIKTIILLPLLLSSSSVPINNNEVFTPPPPIIKCFVDKTTAHVAVCEVTGRKHRIVWA